MICFTLELKYRRENPFDSQVYMARHRMGARGNETSFPLPWERILQELRQTETASVAPQLPWVGEELANKVAIMLKTKDDDDPKSVAQLIHQAQVRRRVVVQLIDGARARGHRAYLCVNMDRVREKANRLPENGVPPELVRLLPHDEDLDKVQLQKLRRQLKEVQTQPQRRMAWGRSAPTQLFWREAARRREISMRRALLRCGSGSEAGPMY